jgi:hypothetical protein
VFGVKNALLRQLSGPALVAALVSPVSAQQLPPPLDLAAITVDKEPQHKVVFANESIRVIEARFRPGSMSLKHAHAADTVTIMLSPGRDDAESQSHVGRAEFNKAGFSHIVTNPGKEELRFLDVEILTSGSIAPDTSSLPRHTLEFENDKVRIYRVVLTSGQSIAGHSHGHGWLSVVVKGGGSGPGGIGAYSWHPAGSKDALTNTGTGSLEMVELEAK